MTSINLSEFWNLNRLIEIASRCGLNPSAMEIYLEFPENDSGYCHLTALECDVSEVDKGRTKQLWSLLGLDSSGYRRVDTPQELDALLDKALDLAPRPRSR